jgi:hypothetical protein
MAYTVQLHCEAAGENVEELARLGMKVSSLASSWWHAFFYHQLIKRWR